MVLLPFLEIVFLVDVILLRRLLHKLSLLQLLRGRLLEGLGEPGHLALQSLEIEEASGLEVKTDSGLRVYLEFVEVLQAVVDQIPNNRVCRTELLSGLVGSHEVLRAEALEQNIVSELQVVDSVLLVLDFEAPYSLVADSCFAGIIIVKHCHFAKLFRRRVVVLNEALLVALRSLSLSSLLH